MSDVCSFVSFFILADSLARLLSNADWLARSLTHSSRPENNIKHNRSLYILEQIQIINKQFTSIKITLWDSVWCLFNAELSVIDTSQESRAEQSRANIANPCGLPEIDIACAPHHDEICRDGTDLVREKQSEKESKSRIYRIYIVLKISALERKRARKREQVPYFCCVD